MTKNVDFNTSIIVQAPPREPTAREVMKEYLERLKQEIVLIDQIAADMEAKGIKESEIAAYKSEGGDLIKSWGIDKKIQHRETDIENLNKEIAKLEAALIALSPVFSPLIQSCNTVMNSIEELTKNGKLTKAADVKEAVRQILQFLTQLITALKVEAEVGMDQALIDDLMKSDDPDVNLVKKYVQQLMNDDNRVTSILLSYFSQLSDAIQTLNKDYNKLRKEDADKSFMEWFAEQMVAGLDKTTAKERFDEALMKAFNTAMEAVVDELASSSPALMHMTMEIDDLLKKLITVLNSDLSFVEKSNQIKKLMTLALGIAAVMIQTIAKEKKEAQQRMAKASVDTIQASLEDTIIEQKAFEVAQERQKVMKKIQLASTIITGAVMMAAAPEVGAQMAIAAMTAASASGALDKLSEKLAHAAHISKVTADFIIGAIAGAATAGTGAALDAATNAAMSSFVSASLETADTQLEEILTQTANKITTQLTGKMPVEEITKEVAKIQTVIKQTAQLAAEKTGRQFMQKNLQTLIVKAMESETKNVLVQEMKEAAVIAAEEASEKLVPLAGKIGSSTDKTITNEVAAIQKNAATNGAAKATGESSETIEKNTGKTGWERASKRGANANEFSFLSTNGLIDALKKMGAIDDSDTTVITLLQMLQTVRMMTIQTGLTGFSPSGSGAMPILKTGLESVGIGLNVGAEIGIYEALKAQKKTVKPIAEDQAKLTVTNFLQDRISREGKQEDDRDSGEMRTMMQSAFDVSSHLYTDALGNLLASQAV